MFFEELFFDVNSYDNDKYNTLSYDEKLHDVSLCDETLYHVIDYKETLYHETLRATSLQSEIVKDGVSRQFMKSIVPKKGSLAAVIRSYKSAVTKFANENKILFSWQTRYFDHIVHNADEFQRIYKYIEENPLKWSNDTFYRK
jgi:hypothetical protein